MERVETLVIGGGQAGLSVGYHLARRKLPFLIVDANQRTGDAWRNRWDSLRLFTPARYNGLDGMPFPAPRHSFPTKDEFADYLALYATRFELPVRHGVRVEKLAKRNGRFLISAGQADFESENVVVAMANYQVPWIPPFAKDLSPHIVQLHAVDYRNPAQLGEGDVLVVGAGNSGAEIALDVVDGRRTLLSGEHPGYVPVRIESMLGRVVMTVALGLVNHRVLTTGTPVGRKASPKILSHGGPLIRTKPKDLVAAGVERVPRVVGMRDGLPLLEDEQVAEVGNVIWCTGFRPGFDWIALPIFEDGWPIHERGAVAREPGLYFVGLMFTYSLSSVMVQGVGRDAAFVADRIAERSRAPGPV